MNGSPLFSELYSGFITIIMIGEYTIYFTCDDCDIKSVNFANTFQYDEYVTLTPILN